MSSSEYTVILPDWPATSLWRAMQAPPTERPLASPVEALPEGLTLPEGAEAGAGDTPPTTTRLRGTRMGKAAKALRMGRQELVSIVLGGTKSLLETEVAERVARQICLLYDLLGPLFRSTEKALQLLASEEEAVQGDPEDKTATPSERPEASEQPKTRRPGHGRNGVDKFTGADRVQSQLDAELESGCLCGGCLRGKLYDAPSEQVLRFLGKPPIQATVYELEKRRCNLCGQLYTAKMPEGVGDKRHDETVGSALALMKYGMGIPFYRMEKFQLAMGVPLPASTQWGIIKDAADAVEPVFEAMIDSAAQADQVYNDDTGAKILKLRRPDDDKRTGVHTTSILAELAEGVTVSLFFTGRQHAGENLRDVLVRRGVGLPPVRQMCDGLDKVSSPKMPRDFEIVLSNCLTHGRRQFVNIIDYFPNECRRVVIDLGKVYGFDAEAREKKMSPQQRLEHHQSFSEPVLTELRNWMTTEMEEKRVEPNSSLGKAMAYFLNRWEKLTRFLCVPGAPLDNNLCERALKLAVLHRKNALFFLTANGAHVSDVFMSIIQTCRLNSVAPFDYLTALQRHRAEVRQSPGDWLPWNYKNALVQITTPSAYLSNST